MARKDSFSKARKTLVPPSSLLCENDDTADILADMCSGYNRKAATRLHGQAFD